MEVYFVQSKASIVINTILMLIVGALFIYDKNMALEIGFYVAGICLVIAGIIPMIIERQIDLMGIIMIILGIIVCLIPQLLTSITIVAIGIIAIIVGVIFIFGGIKATDKPQAFPIVAGALIVLAGILTFMGNDIAFIIFGVMLVIAGVVNVIALLKA